MLNDIFAAVLSGVVNNTWYPAAPDAVPTTLKIGSEDTIKFQLHVLFGDEIVSHSKLTGSLLTILEVYVRYAL
jgi:hypothetical protein